MPEAPRSRLALFLALGYTVLVVYASLAPFSGWRDAGTGALQFLTAPIPRYVTAFDVIVNTLAYIPLGFLVAAAALARLRPGAAAVAGAIAGALLSVVMEVLQEWLPARVASNIDLLTNVAGAIVGAVLAGRAASVPALVALPGVWRKRLLLPGGATEIAAALVALWFFSQMNPSLPLLGIVFFSDGVQAQLAGVAGDPSSRLLGPVSVGLNLLAIGLLLMRIMHSRRAAVATTAGIVVVAAAIKLFAATLLLKREAAFLWVSREVVAALAVGVISVLAASGLPRRWLSPCCGAALAGMIALSAARPGEPFAVLSLRFFRWTYGQLLNFNGLAAAVAEAWPYAALAVLVLLWRQDAAAVRAPPG